MGLGKRPGKMLPTSWERQPSGRKTCEEKKGYVARNRGGEGAERSLIWEGEGAHSRDPERSDLHGPRGKGLYASGLPKV